MKRPDAKLRLFARALLAGGIATRSGGIYRVPGGPKASANEVEALIGTGALAGDRSACRANAETSGWLKRAYLDADGLAAQHRLPAIRPDGVELNLAESPLARLAAPAAGEAAFLEPHQVEAGERVRKLVDRAQLQPRVTMSYSAASTKGGRGSAAGISDFAADARRSVADIYRVLPHDCADAVIDVCGLLKGLQEVERDRGWPRRSGKLVLRIGLEQLAQHYGLGPVAIGAASRKARRWMEEGARPQRFE